MVAKTGAALAALFEMVWRQFATRREMRARETPHERRPAAAQRSKTPRQSTAKPRPTAPAIFPGANAGASLKRGRAASTGTAVQPYLPRRNAGASLKR